MEKARVKIHYTRWPRTFDRWVALGSTMIMSSSSDLMSRYLNGLEILRKSSYSDFI